MAVPFPMFRYKLTWRTLTSRLPALQVHCALLEEATGKIKAFHIKRKNDAADQLLKYVAWVERQTGKKVKKGTMDGADNSEYAKSVELLCLDGIYFNLSVNCTSAEYGLVERANRTLKTLSGPCCLTLVCLTNSGRNVC